MAIISLYKPLGWTPLQSLDALRETQPELADVPMTYTGRLDPMAEGLIVVLTGDDRYRKPEFQKLPKTYEAEIVFGLSSDTHDALGLMHVGGATDQNSIADAIGHLVGTHTLPFPAYSAYRIKGKPLHYWAQTGRLNEVEIPMKEMGVLSVRDVVIEERSFGEVQAEALRKIALVQGTFRQEQIIDSWNSIESISEPLLVAKCTIEVTSGTYIRSLAHMLGEQLGCGGLLFALKRTTVGDYDLNTIRVQI